jgi:D-alanyl-D-alanine-carboxypeptidase/D-alanyl-D-alanine-endopeptidase
LHLRRIALVCLALPVVIAGCRRAPQRKTAALESRKPAPPKDAEVPIGPPLDTADFAAHTIFERTASTGMVITIVRGKETWSKGYGRVTPVSNDVPGPMSLLRLCSITKILATDVLGKLIAGHVVNFDDPLQKFAPQSVSVPIMTAHGPADRPINLGDLATHTAGLPREIAYPPAGMAHFTFPDFKYRWEWLPAFRLRTSPGYAAHYSNVGFDLLADALGAATRQDYAALFQEETAQPLGMVDTTLTPNQDQCSRLMSGAKEPSECSDTQAAAGSGGMYSTAKDMALFMRYLLSLPGVPAHQNGISTGMYYPDPTKLHSIQGLGHAGVPTGIGLGWIELYGDHGEARIVQKTGGGAGFQTYIALDPARHTGIFIATTDGRHHGGINMFREANDLLLTMAGLTPIPADTDDPERERTADELEEAAAVAKAAHHGRSKKPIATSHRAGKPVATPHKAVGKPAVTQRRAVAKRHAPAAKSVHPAPKRKARR